MIQNQNHMFIDSAECGSSVGYYLHINEYESTKESRTEYSLQATVVLTDCNHKIDWSFNDGEEKIDNAIHMLQEFRKKYLAAKAMVENLNKK